MSKPRTDKQMGAYAPIFREIKAEREAGVSPEREEELRIREFALSSRFNQGLTPTIEDPHILRTIAGIIRGGIS